MPAVWKLFVAHVLADIQPTLTTGTAVAGYAHGNMRTLNPNTRAKVTGVGAPEVVTWTLDRGAVAFNVPASGALLSAYIALSNTVTPTIVADNDVLFGSVTTLRSGAAVDCYPFGAFTFSENAERYVRITLAASGPDIATVGAFSLTRVYTLGLPVFSSFPHSATTFAQPNQLASASGMPMYQGGGTGIRSYEFLFRNVSSTSADEMIGYFGIHRGFTTDDTALNYLGGGGGSVPVALAKFAATTDTHTASVIYGYASVRVNQWSPAISEVTISITEWPIGHRV